ncbi:MAG TPA: geranylgeranylglyceryl/heptaprenylglyceryl phosphate synthase [Bacteroidia bacterium]|nr:geranylgeranylglyceryl/heptaprenylglyceryl phosphate synthase [Bacteroidia bacterium]
MNKIYQKIISAQKKKQAQLAVLIDPDKFNPQLITLANQCNVHYFFVGGSELTNGNIEKTISTIKKLSKIPVIIFPGDEKQLSAKADAILFLSLLSGRNPDYLIGKQVLAAPFIKQKKLECISTAYILVDGNKKSTTQKVTNTKPLSDTKTIINTSIAAELLGFKTVYLEAGSGAKKNINISIIKKVKQNISLPLLVGGGIDSVTKAKQAIKAGADVLVIGNALEKNSILLKELSLLFKKTV